MEPNGKAWLREEFHKAGKKLDMGKSCIRLQKAGDLPPEVIGKIAGGQTVDEFPGCCEAMAGGRGT